MPGSVGVEQFPVSRLSTLKIEVIFWRLHCCVQYVVSHLEHVKVDDELSYLTEAHIFASSDHFSQILLHLGHSPYDEVVDDASGRDV